MISEFNKTNLKSNFELSVNDQQFVEYIQNVITVYGQIPYEVPTKLIVEVIKNCGRYFHRMYYKATEQKMFLLPLSEIHSHLKDKQKEGETISLTAFSVQLPSYVYTIVDIYENTRPNYHWNSGFESENFFLLQRSSAYGQTMVGINNNMYIIERAAKMVEMNNLNSIYGTSVPFEFNQLSNILYIKNQLRKDLVIECLTKINIEYLYNDDLFIKYVVASVKKELKRVLGSHTIQLPGDVTMNVDEITLNYFEDMQAVEEAMRAASGIGDIIMMR